ncbi:MAG: translation initiation factor IF-2 [Candidatus Marinimicrobia bacterium]|nr:translation initiation factor IF-2 [Candidatus Neomarinimicrobiota bacterium]
MAKKKDTKKQDNQQIVPRPPIVVVMGHIDHGKTTLLDFIRKTKVTEQEAGGITQHVSAYEIEVQDRKITFIDTPGHEAFSKIRKRGAKIADVAILIIAADDKVNSQTIETLDAIKKDGLPFVIALNKVDKENANSEKIKKELSEKEVYIEEWGGKIPCVEISAKTGKGIDDLLEMVLLMADMEELKTNPAENASGFVLESRVDKKRGTEATLLIQNGKLKQGMCVAVSGAFSPVRIFEDFKGKPTKESGASSPVVVVGFNNLPVAGEKFESFASKKEAEEFARKANIDIDCEVGQLESVAETEKKDVVIPLIIKADTAGSSEAIEKQFVNIKNDKVSISVLRSGIGDINEDDIKLASSGDKSLIVGFNVKCPSNISLMAEKFGVDIKLFDIIYEAEDWIRGEIKKREPIEIKEEVVGKAKILKIFRTEKSKKIIGGEILSGKIKLNGQVRIMRRDFELGMGRITELQKQKTKASEVGEGEQFGALVQTKVEVSPQDTLELIEKVEA